MATKLSKSIKDGILTVKIMNGEEIVEQLDFNSAKLNDQIKFNLMLHGLSQKIGDSAAGKKEPEEMSKAMTHVWNGLEKGDWSVRAPSEKLSKEVISKKLAASGMSEGDIEAAKALFAKLGLAL